MENHLDHRIALSEDSEFESLYEWSLHELDAKGKKIGRDQIPWGWSLYFDVTELSLTDDFDVEVGDDIDGEGEGDGEVEFVARVLAEEGDAEGDGRVQRAVSAQSTQSIRATLSPAASQASPWEPAYSMFGTNRTVESFQLYIRPLDEEGQRERCIARGAVSFSAETDVGDELKDDSIEFYLFVKPSTFASYAQKITTKQISDVGLRVGRVAGFYSDWAPGITTSKIKVLCSEGQHVVEAKDGCQILPPRLGNVGRIQLVLNSRCKVQPLRQEGEPYADDPQLASLRQMAISNVRTVKLLASLRVSAWVIAGLLVALILMR